MTKNITKTTTVTTNTDAKDLDGILEKVKEAWSFIDSTGEQKLITDDMLIRVTGKHVVINGDVQSLIVNGKELAHLPKTSKTGGR